LVFDFAKNAASGLGMRRYSVEYQEQDQPEPKAIASTR
jgi:hypothetical protein